MTAGRSAGRREPRSSRERQRPVCALLAASLGLHAQSILDSRDPSAVSSRGSRSRRFRAPSPSNPDKVRLGEKLFHDVRLSRGDVTTCASCHRLAEGGDDNLARSPGIGGKLLDFNTPTVFNAALSFRLNWRGNFRSLEEQIEAVLLDPV